MVIKSTVPGIYQPVCNHKPAQILNRFHVLLLAPQRQQQQQQSKSVRHLYRAVMDTQQIEPACYLCAFKIRECSKSVCFSARSGPSKKERTIR